MQKRSVKELKELMKLWDYWTLWVIWTCGIIDRYCLSRLFVSLSCLVLWRRNVVLLCVLSADLMLYLIIFRCYYDGCMYNTQRLLLATTRHSHHRRPPIRRMLAKKCGKHLWQVKTQIVYGHSELCWLNSANAMDCRTLTKWFASTDLNLSASQAQATITFS